MAFTQKQKEQISLMIDSPDVFLDAIKEKKIFLDGFKEEFFKDGSGFYHFLLNSVIRDKTPKKENLIKLFEYVVENSSINLFQSIGRKPSAVDDVLYDKELTIDLISARIFLDIAKKIKNRTTKWKLNTYNYSNFKEDSEDDLNRKVEAIVLKLINKADIQLSEIVDFIIKEKISSKEIRKKLIFKAIDNKDLNQLKYIIENLNLKKEDIKNFHKRIQGAPSYSYGVSSSVNVFGLLAYSLKENSIDCFEYLWDNDLTDKTGKVEHDSSGYYSTKEKRNVINPIGILLSLNNKEHNHLIQKMFKDLSVQEKLKVINETNLNDYSSSRNIKSLFDLELSELIVEIINDVLKSEKIENTEKINLINRVINIGLMEMKDLNKFNLFFDQLQINPDEKWIKATKEWNNTGLDIFTDPKEWRESLYLNPEEQKEYVKLVLSLHKNGFLNGNRNSNGNIVYNKLFFWNPEIIPEILKNVGFENVGFKTRKNKTTNINLFEIGYELFAEIKTEKQSKLLFDRSFKAIKKTNPDLIFDKIDENYLISYVVGKKEDFWLKLITDEDIKLFVQKGFIEESIIANRISGSEKNNYDVWINRLVDQGVLFLNNKQNFYALFNNLNDTSILEKIVKNGGVDLNEEFNSFAFWQSMKYVEISEHVNYFKNLHNIEIKNDKILLNLIDYGKTVEASIFLDFCPNPFIKDDETKNNALHLAIKEKYFEFAKTLVERYPDLAKEQNQAGKIPLTYLFVPMAKECEECEVSENVEKNKLKDLFEKVLSAGLTKNESGIKKLEKYFTSYPVITRTYPELTNLYLKKSIEKDLVLTRQVVKKNKI